jgi:hypothetical protein
MTTGIANEHRRWSFRVSADDVSEDLSPVEVPDAVTNTVDALREWGELEPKVASKEPHLLWRDPEAHPLALLFIVLDRYGNEALEWPADVLKATLERDGVALAHSAWSKILAARVLMLSTSPWKRWNTFHWVARGLCGLPPNFTYLEVPEIWHLAVMADCMRAVDPKRAVGLDVQKFVAATLAHEGIRYAPPPLQFAQRELEERRVTCRACGAHARDDNDQVCITCGSKELEHGVSEFKDLASRTEAWVKAHKQDKLEELSPALSDAAGHCGARLLMELAQVYERRRALSAQLRHVGKR